MVEVDSDTGKVTWVRHVAVDDCGRILNPMLVNGQQHGGIAQGAAQALFEWVQYDEDGNPITGNLMDYAMPSAAEMPSFEVSNTQTDSPRNPLGAKGIGQSGTIGSTPAIHNVVRRGRPPRREAHRHALHRPACVGGDQLGEVIAAASDGRPAGPARADRDARRGAPDRGAPLRVRDGCPVPRAPLFAWVVAAEAGGPARLRRRVNVGDAGGRRRSGGG